MEPDDTKASDSSSESEDDDEPQSPVLVHHPATGQPSEVPSPQQQPPQQIPSENTLKGMNFHPSLGQVVVVLLKLHWLCVCERLRVWVVLCKCEMSAR